MAQEVQVLVPIFQEEVIAKLARLETRIPCIPRGLVSSPRGSRVAMVLQGEEMLMFWRTLKLRSRRHQLSLE